jgi:hypothetical protein
MEYSIVSRDGFLEVKTIGDGELQALANMLAELVSHPQSEPGGKLLVDHSELNAGPITANDVRFLADKCVIAMCFRSRVDATLVGGTLDSRVFHIVGHSQEEESHEVTSRSQDR